LNADALLRHIDERIIRLALRRPPSALVDKIRVPGSDEILRRQRATIEDQLFEL